MRKIYTDNLKRYEVGLYKGKIDWSNNIGVRLKFIYNEIEDEIEIVNYLKEIPQGIVTLKYKDNLQTMKSNMLMKCCIGKLIGYHNYDYLYDIGDILNTNFNSSLLILEKIKILHTNYNERGYTVKCSSCNHVFEIREVHISSCPNCSDRVSYPEKFVINMFRQLNEYIELQKTFEWSGLKRYDVYVPKYNMIIEVNGLIHYEPCYLNMISKNKNETNTNIEFQKIQQNDKDKYDLAIKNKILNYIIIDARKSNMSYIKHSILKKSIISFFYNLNDINWLECHEFALKTIVRDVSILWNENNTKDEISKLLNIPISAVNKNLRDGNELGYCIYDKRINYINGRKNSKKIKQNYKPVICLTTGEIFESQSAAAVAYGVYKTGVNDCCAGRIPSAGKHPITKESLKWAHYLGESNIQQ